LTDEGKALWRRLAGSIELDEAAAAILALLAESFDRMREAQAHIKTHGIVFEEKTAAGNSHYRQNPACGVERDSRSAIIRCYRALGLDLEPSL
jgi:P27 family predicted phage terminase small subunit